NMIDSILTFWVPSKNNDAIGGFAHVLGSGINGMANEQALYGLIAYDRYLKGKNTLYDMTDMQGKSPNSFKARTNTVTFNLNGESTTKSVSPYEVIELAAKDVDGREFISWNTKEDGSGTVYLPEESLVAPDKDITLYGQDESIEYDIVYETNGGQLDNTGIQTSYTVDDEVSLPNANQIERDEFHFVGWFDNADFAGEAISTIEIGNYGDL